MKNDFTIVTFNSMDQYNLISLINSLRLITFSIWNNLIRVYPYPYHLIQNYNLITLFI